MKKFTQVSGGIEVLKQGQLGSEITRIMGQIVRVFEGLEATIKEKSGFMDRMKLVELLYQTMKKQGK